MTSLEGLSPEVRMSRFHLKLIPVLLLSFLLYTNLVHAAPPGGYSLVWSDEFNGTAGTAPNSANWGYDTGATGWGNNELENYSNSTANAQIVADANAGDGKSLAIITLDPGGNNAQVGNYTSARINTSGKQSFQYGYMEARIRLPFGQGIWPAYWMLGQNIGSVGWPACGETDIGENIGSELSVNHGSLHAPNYNPTAIYTLGGGAQFKDAYHTFAVLWGANQIQFYVDDVLYETDTAAQAVAAGGTWEFNQSFFFILNTAVGGNFPGPPNGSTSFPQTMLVDYVRVYQNVGPTFTPTFTATNSTTPTATRTFTSTFTATNSFTSTKTNTPTSTSTYTAVPPTNTFTLTSTATNTASPTRTSAKTSISTDTPTATPSSTPTGTSTSANTNTPQPPTNTPTPTVSSTPTGTSTYTRTNTPVATLTNTPTMPNTSTPTASKTPSGTPTASPTPTSSATLTATPLALPTRTSTNTPISTNTPTSIQTNTPVPPTNTSTSTTTNSSTPTYSFTATNTSTSTFTSTPTRTSIATSTNSSTSTATHTSTLTSTPIFTAAITSTLTLSLTFTLTPTSTTTFSANSTLSSTPTPSFTPTFIPSNVPTFTQTFTSTPVVYPNPWTGSGQAHLKLFLAASGEVKVKLFTASFRKVWLEDFPNEPAGNDDLVLNLPGFANGIYYLVVTSPSGRFIVKLLIVK